MSLGYVIVDSKHKDTDGSVRYGVVSENEYNEEIVYLDTLARTKEIALIFLTTFIIAGCDANTSSNAPQLHTCTTENLVDVQKYLDVCGQTGYYKSYCFDRGVESFCTEKKAKE